MVFWYICSTGQQPQQKFNLFLRTGLAARLETGLLSGLLEDCVDTIWQCTVPNKSMRHNGPTTSLALAAGTSKYNTAPATGINTSKLQLHTENLVHLLPKHKIMMGFSYLSTLSEIFKEWSAKDLNVLFLWDLCCSNAWSRHTLKKVQDQDTGGDTFWCNLDPPLKEERKEKDPDQSFTGNSSPRALRFGLAKRGTCKCHNNKT